MQPILDITNLHDYQHACVKHIINNHYCGLFLEMGLGKTVSTLTAIDFLKFDYCEITRVLVIAPKRVIESVWQEEAQLWKHLQHLTFSKVMGAEAKRIEALKKPADIYLISRDNVSWLCALYGGIYLPFDMVVVDELSSFKSYKALRFKALKACRPSLKRFVGLTGTPAPNGLINLWPQIYLMDRGERLEKTITRYRDKYFKPGHSNGNIVYSYVPLEASEKLIADKISDICISMKAEDYIKLPEVINNYINLEMPDELKAKYKAFERDKVLELYDALPDEEKNLSAITAINATALSNKLLQFANGAIYDEDKEIHELHDIKLEALEDIIDCANGKPILVAWTFRFDLYRIMRYFKKLKPRELKSDKDIADWNAGKIQLLLTHPASAGHGLNLQAGGNIIVWYGQTWSLELYQQFNARLHRQGQKNNVIINHLITKGTPDEDVIAALKRKEHTQNALINSVKAKIKKYIKG